MAVARVFRVCKCRIVEERRWKVVMRIFADADADIGCLKDRSGRERKQTVFCIRKKIGKEPQRSWAVTVASVLHRQRHHQEQ